MDEKILSKLTKILDGHYDELFRGELYFPLFKILSYERASDTVYKVTLELLYLDSHNYSDCAIENTASIFAPVFPRGLNHMITIEVVSWETKEQADELTSDPYLIEIESTLTEEKIEWDDPRTTDEQIENCLSRSGLDPTEIAEDEELKQVVTDFLNSDDPDLESIRNRLKPFLIKS